LWELRLVVEVVVRILILICLILYLIWLVILTVQTPPLRLRRQELQVVVMELQVAGHLVATVLTVASMDLVEMSLMLW